MLIGNLGLVQHMLPLVIHLLQHNRHQIEMWAVFKSHEVFLHDLVVLPVVSKQFTVL